MRGKPLSGHDSSVESVALDVLDGHPVVLSGDFYGSVLLWDARAGVALGKPLHTHAGSVHSLALGTLNGKPVLVSGCRDGIIQLWYTRTHQSAGKITVGGIINDLKIAYGSVVAITTTRGLLVIDI